MWRHRKSLCPSADEKHQAKQNRQYQTSKWCALTTSIAELILPFSRSFQSVYERRSKDVVENSRIWQSVLGTPPQAKSHHVMSPTSLFPREGRPSNLKTQKTTLIVVKMWSYHWLPHEGLPFTKPKPCPWSRFQNFRGRSDRNLLPLLPSFNWISSQNVKEIVESSVYKKNSGWSMEELRIYRQVKYRKDGHIYLDVACEC